MKIIFDSNVWQIIVLPDDPQFIDEPLLADFKKIRQAIVEKKIEPFLSETVFTIEAIRKVERQDFFSSQKPKIDIEENVAKNDVVSLGISIGPNEEDAIDFTDRPILKKYFDEAIKLGFNIANLPRIGGLVNKEIEKVRYKLEDEALSKYHQTMSAVGQKIEANGAGITHIKAIGNQYEKSNWMKGLKSSPKADRNKIAKAAAEWADGDSVAISIALGCDYFCTRDQGKVAGSKSVLSQTNLTWLKYEYEFETILPENLAKLI